MLVKQRQSTFSIPEFCKAHGISRATFYNMLKEGSAPLTVKIRSRRLIPTEAAERWLTELTAQQNGGK